MSALALVVLAQAADRSAQIRDAGVPIPLAQRLIGLLGLATMLLIAWLMSYDRRRVPWRLVAPASRCRASSASWC